MDIVYEEGPQLRCAHCAQTLRQVYESRQQGEDLACPQRPR
jgi:hypothetical protein